MNPVQRLNSIIVVAKEAIQDIQNSCPHTHKTYNPEIEPWHWEIWAECNYCNRIIFEQQESTVKKAIA